MDKTETNLERILLTVRAIDRTMIVVTNCSVMARTGSLWPFSDGNETVGSS